MLACVGVLTILGYVCAFDGLLLKFLLLSGCPLLHLFATHTTQRWTGLVACGGLLDRHVTNDRSCLVHPLPTSHAVVQTHIGPNILFGHSTHKSSCTSHAHTSVPCITGSQQPKILSSHPANSLLPCPPTPPSYCRAPAPTDTFTSVRGRANEKSPPESPKTYEKAAAQHCGILAPLPRCAVCSTRAHRRRLWILAD